VLAQPAGRLCDIVEVLGHRRQFEPELRHNAAVWVLSQFADDLADERLDRDRHEAFKTAPAEVMS
jgi:hypothetical protein